MTTPNTNTRKNAVILRWMKRNAGNYLDDCDEINCTQLGEDAAEHFNDYLNENYDIKERYFDLAFDASVWYDTRRPQPQPEDL